jgi:hypothetical protein
MNKTDHLILPDFVMTERVNLRAEYSGMDHPDYCFDRDHFDQYPYKISYEYNSRGFRDAEWPTRDLDQCIWCVGDSFTVGLGSPVEHTWPWLLQQQQGRRTVNVSLDGASNTWIARRATAILEHIQPAIMIIQWSYTNRRESQDTTLTDEQRRIWTTRAQDSEDVLLLVQAIQAVEAAAHTARVIHSFIPNFINNEHRQVSHLAVTQTCPEYIAEIQQQDWARDHHHYDLVTAQAFVDQVRQRLG